MASTKTRARISREPSAETADETRLRLMAAAMRCVERWGVEKTGLNDIAREAGCARQTVYNHFANAEAVILAALLESSQAFVTKLLAVVRAYRTPGRRVVEAMMFCLETVPNEPSLRLIADPKFGPLANLSVFDTEASWSVLRGVAAECLAPDPRLASSAERVDELAEMMTRLLLSLLTLEGPVRRSPDETRALLRRWLLPPLARPRP